MRLHFVWLTLGKELRETLRDRRTLAVMILFPLVVYPLLALVGTQLVASRKQSEEARASQVAVVGDGPLADQVRGHLDRAPKLFKRHPTGTRADVDGEKLDALVTITPPVAGAGADAAGGAVSPAGQARAHIAFDATRSEGRQAEERLTSVLSSIWPAGCAPQYDVEPDNLAPATRTSGYLLSKALPLMILLMVLLGAFYPAIDVTAGERERGTLETVLSAPIPRLQLLAGKVLAVTVLASVSGLLNLISMSLALVQVVNLAAPATELPVPWIRAAATGLVVVPTAFLLAALFVAVGSLARGFKEAQNLLVPVYFLFFAPAMLGAMGDLPLSFGLALVPGLNVSLLARDIALGKAGVGITTLVLAATVAGGAVALLAAARLYVSERFLSAADPEADRPRPLRGRPNPARRLPPTSGDALSMFAIGYLLLYFVLIPLQRRDLIGGLLISQWLGLFGLTLLYALLTRRSPVPAFAVRPAAAAAWAGAALMALGGWMVANLIGQWVLAPPPEYIEAFRRMLFPETQARGLLASLALFALTPAVCEELFFRGLILRGLLTRVPPATAIALCAAMFGIYHVDVYRLVPTTLLGGMLGFIAWRSGSLLPAILAHFLNNAVLVSLGTAGLDRRIDAFGAVAKGALLVGAALLVAVGALILFRLGPPRSPDPGPEGPLR
jgi:sodium transport system permease protein